MPDSNSPGYARRLREIQPFKVMKLLARANASDYGLAAGLWSQDVSRVRRMADRLHAGTVWVNCWGETDAASPFGGVKQSGYGREMGKDAIALYSQTKSVWVA